MARGLCFCSSCLTSSRSRMSPLTKTWRESARSASRLRGLPAYVSLSRLTIGSPVAAMDDSTKFEPMKPAPPVTNSMRGLSLIHSGRLAEPREPQTQEQHGEDAVLVVQRRVHRSHTDGDDPCARRAAPQQPVELLRIGPRPESDHEREPRREHGKQRDRADQAPLGKGVEVETV